MEIELNAARGCSELETKTENEMGTMVIRGPAGIVKSMDSYQDHVEFHLRCPIA